ncbi:MAG: xanthine phosphoribosyltransferase [Chloroflexia bacterium]|nr:xanthine phosphoribosyltransferase [Chloroflexia bacterium]
MEALRQRVLREGRHLGKGIIKVDSFINHQVDAALMVEAGRELGRRFAASAPDKILTAEISGIAPAVCTGLALGLPIVYARKSRPITMPDPVYRRTAPSHTKGKSVELLVSPEVLKAGERVLIVDDFLASGRTILALVGLVEDAGAVLVGIGAVIEKRFEGGRQELASLDVPIEALVVIERVEGERMILAPDN